MCCDRPTLPCLLLPEAERKTGLQRVKVDSRYVKLEAARKQWQEPTLLPEQSLS